MFLDVVNREKMQEIDRYSIEKMGIPSMVLMERAALAVSKYIQQEEKSKVLCVCGMGNNGGDGAAVARILKESGWDTSVLFVGNPEKQTKQCKQQMNIARKLSIPVHFFSSSEEPNRIEQKEYNIIVDAVFGIGLKREVQGDYLSCIQSMNRSGKKIYSVDIPSGINAEDGQVLGEAVRADVTVTFGVQKTGLLLAPGYLYAGTVYVENVGFPKQAVDHVKPDIFCYQNFRKPETDMKRECLVKENSIRKEMEALLPARKKESNKGSYGKILLIAGSRGMAGAACLCAKAAYRMGSGLVKVFSEEGNRIVLQTSVPEAIFSGYASGDWDGSRWKEKLQKEIDWADVVVIGPGLGTGNEASDILESVLKKTEEDGKKLVVDADAINLLAGQSGKWELSGKNMVFTPHLKEMERLSGRSVEELRRERMNAVSFLPFPESTLVLKDAHTIVQNKNRTFINTRGTNGMATGGSGDVLSGILGGILASGESNFEGAVKSVLIHALLGELAAEKWSEHGMLAGDIVDAMQNR